MIEVRNNLFVGDDDDYKAEKWENDWAIVQCAKEPYHRNALDYATAGAPKDHPEYLFAHRNRPKRIILNMIDADDPKYFHDRMINAALNFIDQWIQTRKVLIHCNKGESRAPGLAMLWMGLNGELDDNFMSAYLTFMVKYPKFDPRPGMRAYLLAKWPNA